MSGGRTYTGGHYIYVLSCYIYSYPRVTTYMGGYTTCMCLTCVVHHDIHVLTMYHYIHVCTFDDYTYVSYVNMCAQCYNTYGAEHDIHVLVFSHTTCVVKHDIHVLMDIHTCIDCIVLQYDQIGLQVYPRCRAPHDVREERQTSRKRLCGDK